MYSFHHLLRLLSSGRYTGGDQCVFGMDRIECLLAGVEGDGVHFRVLEVDHENSRVSTAEAYEVAKLVLVIGGLIARSQPSAFASDVLVEKRRPRIAENRLRFLGVSLLGANPEVPMRKPWIHLVGDECIHPTVAEIGKGRWRLFHFVSECVSSA